MITTRAKVISALTDAGYEVIRLTARYAVVRERDIHGQPEVRRIDWRLWMDEGHGG